MAKAFILSNEDFDKLLLMIDRDPKHGSNGGSSDSRVRDREEQEVWDKVS